jgi:hypothetical protein
MHTFTLSSFFVVHEGEKETYFVTSVEIKSQKLYDHDFKGLGSHISINRFFIIN